MTSTKQVTSMESRLSNDNDVKYCHLCLRKFHGLLELRRHIDNDHDLRHPTVKTYESMMKSNGNLIQNYNLNGGCGGFGGFR